MKIKFDVKSIQGHLGHSFRNQLQAGNRLLNAIVICCHYLQSFRRSSRLY